MIENSLSVLAAATVKRLVGFKMSRVQSFLTFFVSLEKKEGKLKLRPSWEDQCFSPLEHLRFLVELNLGLQIWSAPPS